MFLVLPQ